MPVHVNVFLYNLSAVATIVQAALILAGMVLVGSSGVCRKGACGVVIWSTNWEELVLEAEIVY